MAIPWEVANELLKLHTLPYHTLQEENFQKYPNFVILLMANKLNFNSVYYQILEKLSIIEHILNIQKSKFL